MFAICGYTLPPDLARDLLNYLHQTGKLSDPAEAIAIAVRFWLDTMQQRPHQDGSIYRPFAAACHGARHGAPIPGPLPIRGYQWKWLFLPEGSCVRLAQRPELGYAIVVADQLMWNGQSVSPNQFARALTGGLRNAWRDLVLLLPGEQQWKPASVRRRERLQATLAPSLPERRAQRMRARTLADLR